jgi:putative tricarboxylic transport membrane protein
MNGEFWRKSENVFVLVCLVLSGSAFVFVNALIGKPKVLFGKSLTAIAPASFPSIVLAFLALLCILQLVVNLRKGPGRVAGGGIVGWNRGVVFFGIMTVYALILVPIGFIISSALAVAVLSWFVGNRSILQIAFVSALAPVLLYLAATRLLAVSLPELNFIEIAISRLLGG